MVTAGSVKAPTAATLASLFVLIALFGQSAGASSARPHYQPPSHVVAYAIGNEHAEVFWHPAPYADFFLARVSTSKSMKHAVQILDTEPEREASFDIFENLKPGTTYYATVQVASSVGEVLSSPSKVIKFRTPK